MMKSLKGVFSFFVFSFFCSVFVFGACTDSPFKVDVKSGSFSPSTYALAGNEGIYFAGDLKNYPLYLSFHFNNSKNDLNCYSSTDFQFKLTQNFVNPSSEIVRYKDSSGNEISKVSFAFTNYLNTNLSSPIRSVLKVFGKEAGFLFVPLHSGPEVEVVDDSFSFFVKSGEVVNFDYSLSDESGIVTTSISGVSTDSFVEPKTSFSGSVNLSSSSDVSYDLVAVNRVGFRTEKEILVLVDGEGPVVPSIDVIGYEVGVGSNKKMSINFFVKDKSFNYLASSNEGDFFDILSGTIDLRGLDPSRSLVSIGSVCQGFVVDNSTGDYDNYYNCSISGIDISRVVSSSEVEVKFELTDGKGNVASFAVPVSVFVDSNAPEITKFEVMSEGGKKANVVSSKVNATLSLEYSEESLSVLNAQGIKKITEFGLIQYSPPAVESYEGSVHLISWDLSSKFGVYDAYAYKNDSYKVTLVDVFGNRREANVSVVVDNVAPKFLNYTIREVEQGEAEDSLIQSGEGFSVDVYFEEAYFTTSEPRVYGNFSAVVEPAEFDRVWEPESCVLNDETKSVYRCTFTGLTATNGHVIRNVSIRIIDDAGNGVMFMVPIEVFKYKDEQVKTLFVLDRNTESNLSSSVLYIMNPINRNSLLEGGATAWFVGTLVARAPEFEGDYIVKYSVQDCNYTSIEPGLTVDNPESILYPEKLITGNKRDFALRFDILQGDNIYNFVTKNMSCTIGVVRRDNTTIYPAEIVKFNVVFDFYELSHDRNSLLKAKAQDILDMYKVIDDYGENFDKLYKIYITFSTFCNTWSTVRGVVSAVDGVVLGLQVLLTPYPATQKIADTMGMFHRVTNFFGQTQDNTFGVGTFVNKMCNIVTCANNGWISTGFSEWLEEQSESVGGLSDMVCTPKKG